MFYHLRTKLCDLKHLATAAQKIGLQVTDHGVGGISVRDGGDAYVRIVDLDGDVAIVAEKFGDKLMLSRLHSECVADLLERAILAEGGGVIFKSTSHRHLAAAFGPGLILALDLSSLPDVYVTPRGREFAGPLIERLGRRMDASVTLLPMMTDQLAGLSSSIPVHIIGAEKVEEGWI